MNLYNKSMNQFYYIKLFKKKRIEKIFQNNSI